MTSTRERVLNTLLTRPRSTINDLAKSVGINPISVRHHIAKLEAEGLVTSDEELHGVGRPRRVYFLTESGCRAFPHPLYAFDRPLTRATQRDDA
jgi:DeoR family transcriptional regulator, suf operon transcriptional repressor